MTTTDRSRARREAFLAAFAECGVVSIAAEAAGVARQTVYEWRQNDEWFAKAYDEASERAHEVLVQEARRRAKDGYDEYVVSAGRLVLDPSNPQAPLLQRRFSDQLLKFLIERREGAPLQRVEHAGEIKTRDVEPSFVAEVLRALDSAGVADPGENQA